MVSFGEKANIKKAGNLNYGRSYVITTVYVQCNPDLVTHLVCQKSVTKSRGVTK